MNKKNKKQDISKQDKSSPSGLNVWNRVQALPQEPGLQSRSNRPTFSWLPRFSETEVSL